eukprot:6172213-Pleurochrysis_carterae.AAC.3
MRVEAEMTHKNVRRSAKGSARSMPRATARRHDRCSRGSLVSFAHFHATLSAIPTTMRPQGHSVPVSSRTKYPPE